VVITKKVFAEAGGFYTRLCRGEGRGMWRRIASWNSVALINEIGDFFNGDADNRACGRQPKFGESTTF